MYAVKWTTTFTIGYLCGEFCWELLAKMRLELREISKIKLQWNVLYWRYFANELLSSHRFYSFFFCRQCYSGVNECGLLLCASTYLYLSGSKADSNTLFFLKIIGSLYLLWISYKIIKSSNDLPSEKHHATLTFSSGLLIYPLSYKAWLFFSFLRIVHLLGARKNKISLFTPRYFFSPPLFN